MKSQVSLRQEMSLIDKQNDKSMKKYVATFTFS